MKKGIILFTTVICIALSSKSTDVYAAGNNYCDRKRAGPVYESNIHKPGACSYGISLSKKYIYGNEVGSLL